MSVHVCMHVHAHKQALNNLNMSLDRNSLNFITWKLHSLNLQQKQEVIKRATLAVTTLCQGIYKYYPSSLWCSSTTSVLPCCCFQVFLPPTTPSISSPCCSQGKLLKDERKIHTWLSFPCHKSFSGLFTLREVFTLPTTAPTGFCSWSVHTPLSPPVCSLKLFRVIGKSDSVSGSSLFSPPRRTLTTSKAG